MDKDKFDALMKRICHKSEVVQFKRISEDGFRAVVYCDITQSSLCYDDQCSYFIEKFSRETLTNWVTFKRHAHAERYLFRKIFCCHLSTKNKTKKKRKYAANIRNENCPGNIGIMWKQINKNTCKNDPNLRLGLNCMIKLEFVHTHSQYVEDPRLRCSKETVTRFYSYFRAGMSSMAAKGFHEMFLIEMSEDYKSLATTLANVQINPTLRQVTHLHHTYKRNNPRDLLPLVMLEEKIGEMKMQGHYLTGSANWQSTNEPLNLAIITPIMRRVYSECFKLTGAVYTVTAVCSKLNYNFPIGYERKDTKPISRVTFFFVPSKVGALPIGCVMNAKNEYDAAFSLFKKTLDLNNVEEFRPRVIVLENLDQLDTLQFTFSDARRLLNWPRISQALWKWMWTERHQVRDEDGKDVMRCVWEIYESDSVAAAEESYNRFEIMVSRCCPNLWKYFERLWAQRALWCRAFTTDPTPQYHDVCLESTLVFKDAFLYRCKGLNPVAFIDVVCIFLENYFSQRLSAFAFSAESSVPYHFWRFVGTSGSNSSASEVVETGAEEYAVNTPNGTFTVNTDLGVCDCMAGRNCRYCEHLHAVKSLYDWPSRFPVLTDAERDSFGKIAFGSDAHNLVGGNGEGDGVDIDEIKLEHEDLDEDYSISEEKCILKNLLSGAVKEHVAENGQIKLKHEDVEEDYSINEKKEEEEGGFCILKNLLSGAVVEDIAERGQIKLKRKDLEEYSSITGEKCILKTLPSVAEEEGIVESVQIKMELKDVEEDSSKCEEKCILKNLLSGAVKEHVAENCHIKLKHEDVEEGYSISEEKCILKNLLSGAVKEHVAENGQIKLKHEDVEDDYSISEEKCILKNLLSCAVEEDIAERGQIKLEHEDIEKDYSISEEKCILKTLLSGALEGGIVGSGQIKMELKDVKEDSSICEEKCVYKNLLGGVGQEYIAERGQIKLELEDIDKDYSIGEEKFILKNLLSGAVEEFAESGQIKMELEDVEEYSSISDEKCVHIHLLGLAGEEDIAESVQIKMELEDVGEYEYSPITKDTDVDGHCSSPNHPQESQASASLLVDPQPFAHLVSGDDAKESVDAIRQELVRVSHLLESSGPEHSESLSEMRRVLQGVTTTGQAVQFAAHVSRFRQN